MAELSKRQDKIIKYLADSNRPVTGKELSEIIGVSARTIRSDIENIKISVPDLIDATHEGYFIGNEKNLVHSVMSEIDSKDRLILILKRMIVSDETVNMYDLAEELYVSESTILADMKEIKKLTRNSAIDVEFIKLKDDFKIKGEFNSKINLFMYFLMKYYNPLNIYQLHQIFDIDSLEELINSVVKILLKHDFFSRYISLDTIVISLLLIRERSHLKIKSEYEVLGNNKIANELLSLVYEENEEYINSYEYIIINGMKNITEMEKIELEIRNRNIEESEFYNTFLNILEEVEEMYNVDFLSNKKYFLDLIIHANIALFRVRKNISINNPLKGQMKMEYPFLFDIAFYISNRIEEEMGTRLNNEEVSFIVTHLINSFEESTSGIKFENKANVYLITLEGSSIAKYIIDRVKILNDNSNLNVKTISSIYDLKHHEGKIKDDDVIISTTPILINGVRSSLIISPQVNVTDEFKINGTVSKHIEHKKYENFELMFNKFFSEDFVFFDTEYKDREQAIKIISEKFIDEDYIDESYIDSVLERESLLSTSLPTGIALPHATKFNAKKSKVAICFPKRKMKWGELDVNIVMLFVIAKKDKQYLNEFYGLVAEFSASRENIVEVLKDKSFESLKKKLFKFYMERK